MKKTFPLIAAALFLITLTGNAQLTPSGPLEITSNITWTNNLWAKAMKVHNGNALQFDADGHYFGIGATSPNGLYFFSTPTDGTADEATYRMTIRQDGNVGIGTMYPSALLDVRGTFKLGVDAFMGGDAYCIAFTRQGNAHLYGADAQGLLLGGDGTGFDMNILPNGNVGIGTSNPTHKLSVKGAVLAEKMKVSLNTTDWPDYVFHKGYRLPSLSETETFVRRHHHLPNIPSAAQVEKEGLDLGEMNKQLLRKVEELTLHLIEMEKQQMRMQAEIKHLHQQRKTGN